MKLVESMEIASQKADEINSFQTRRLLWTLIDFFRKLLILVVSLSLTNRIIIILIGVINRVLGRPIRSVFLCYPAEEKYAHKYAFKFAFRYMIDNPLVVGIYFQKFRLGLILATSSNEKLFRNNKEYLSKIQKKLDRLRRLIGAEYSHFAGTLPSEMNRLSLIDQNYFAERCEIVADIVIDSEKTVRRLEEIHSACPILLLGGRGSIGKVLKDKLLDQGREVYVIDLGEEFPDTVRDQRAILIDVSRKGVLETRLESLWTNLIILNETFPEPSRAVARRLKSKNINVYHIAGVRAKVFPPFPYAYAGGIPCCAAMKDESIESIVKRL